MGRDDFYQSGMELWQSSHPVTWLRIRLLAARGDAMGYGEAAKATVEEWDTAARTLGVTEDYHGFYGEELRESIARAIDNMLVEAAPRSCTRAEAESDVVAGSKCSLVQVMNHGWRVYRQGSDEYVRWERAMVEQLLQ
jgi:hypothetical protein